MFVLFLGLEIVQVFIPGRTILGGDVLIHLTATAFGGLLGVGILFLLRFSNPALHFSVKGVAVWIMVLIYLSVYPLFLKNVLDGSLISQFRESLARVPLKSDIAGNVLLGFPVAWLFLSSLTAVPDWQFKTRGLWRAVGWVSGIVFSTGVFVETLQYFFAERHPSLFDVFFQALGSLIATGAFFSLKLDRVQLDRKCLNRLGRFNKPEMLALLFILAFLVFEWTPWFPSIQLSTIGRGVRELILPLQSNGYPWDLHWQANRFGAMAAFVASVMSGFSWSILLRNYSDRSYLGFSIMLIASFYGMFVELGKVCISTKNATPLLVVASFLGGFLVLLVILVQTGLRANARMARELDGRSTEEAP